MIVSTVDLIPIYKNSRSISSGIKQLKLVDYHPTFSVGQVIEFWGGNNNDIRMKSEITGFDNDGDIYVLWDCYWSPIRDCKSRNITLVKK